VVTKFLQDLKLTVDDFSGRLKNSRDEEILEAYSSAIKNQRVAQSYKSLMCLIQLCEISLTRSLKEDVPAHI
jgi:hypothetical protein